MVQVKVMVMVQVKVMVMVQVKVVVMDERVKVVVMDRRVMVMVQVKVVVVMEGRVMELYETRGHLERRLPLHFPVAAGPPLGAEEDDTNRRQHTRCTLVGVNYKGQK